MAQIQQRPRGERKLVGLSGSAHFMAEQAGAPGRQIGID
jgi:hypothetical protein